MRNIQKGDVRCKEDAINALETYKIFAELMDILMIINVSFNALAFSLRIQVLAVLRCKGFLCKSVLVKFFPFKVFEALNNKLLF